MQRPARLEHTDIARGLEQYSSGPWAADHSVHLMVQQHAQHFGIVRGAVHFRIALTSRIWRRCAWRLGLGRPTSIAASAEGSMSRGRLPWLPRLLPPDTCETNRGPRQHCLPCLKIRAHGMLSGFQRTRLCSSMAANVGRDSKPPKSGAPFITCSAGSPASPTWLPKPPAELRPMPLRPLTAAAEGLLASAAPKKAALLPPKLPPDIWLPAVPGCCSNACDSAQRFVLGTDLVQHWVHVPAALHAMTEGVPQAGKALLRLLSCRSADYHYGCHIRTGTWKGTCCCCRLGARPMSSSAVW
jgi:hypothetical protein